MPEIVVRDGRRAALALGAAWYGHPGRRLSLIGVTGTNGKTTTTGLLRHLLNATGDVGQHRHARRVRRPRRAGAARPPASLTTPGPIDLQATLADAGGARRGPHVDHGGVVAQPRPGSPRRPPLRRRRLHQPHPRPSRLPRHHGVVPRGQAQARRAARRSEGVEVVNLDDDGLGGAAGLRRAGSRSAFTRQPTCGPPVSCSTPAGSRFRLDGRFGTAEVSLPLLGDFNVANALAAAACALGLGTAADRGGRHGSPPRRRCRGGWSGSARRPASCCATTPTRRTRSSARWRRSGRSPRGRLIVVFGCGGDRDRGKRPIMGRIAAEGRRPGDRHLRQSRAPRIPGAIIDDIEQGMGGVAHLRIVDRLEAIHAALGRGSRGRHDPARRQGARDLPGPRHGEGALRRAGDRAQRGRCDERGRRDARPRRPGPRRDVPRGAADCLEAGDGSDVHRHLDRHARPSSRARCSWRWRASASTRHDFLSAAAAAGAGGAVVRTGTPPVPRAATASRCRTRSAPSALLARARRRRDHRPGHRRHRHQRKDQHQGDARGGARHPVRHLRHAGQPEQPGRRAAHHPRGAGGHRGAGGRGRRQPAGRDRALPGDHRARRRRDHQRGRGTPRRLRLAGRACWRRSSRCSADVPLAVVGTDPPALAEGARRRARRVRTAALCSVPTSSRTGSSSAPTPARS